MSEPIRTSPAKRKQLAAALKRNMARRKRVAVTTVSSEPCAASHGKPQSGWGQRSVGGTRSVAERGAANEPPSINKCSAS